MVLPCDHVEFSFASVAVAYNGVTPLRPLGFLDVVYPSKEGDLLRTLELQLPTKLPCECLTFVFVKPGNPVTTT